MHLSASAVMFLIIRIKPGHIIMVSGSEGDDVRDLGH